MFDHASPQEIDAVVWYILNDCSIEGGIGFPDLEEAVKQRLPNLANHMQVRQSAWRFIRRNKAELTRDLKVRIKVRIKVND